ncbi:hypothetical protein IW140_000814 [Coemansia sp. RSA 1813]|nr:hypothetical protein EV178_001467 [Coemansia sp. RSA 1646]KAJ1768138.1 hypothetical protein LPJ74_004978 [Coemansia sp. RSA 1843]KAJ2093356.1 hypothetical protein IW138_000206 [Coemansia sp. RSA 986]KAJ2217165.1 hypothetical protein EV179_000632 [Coemansia sp. RSA 487]KAJ2572363.1 hypothetical protein IW140_000814 [Coemansia sp. RSA 1813]
MAPTEGIPTVVAAADIKKDEASAASPTLSDETAEKIVTQVKHYFCNANLNHDNYMRKAVEENDGWVNITTLSRFNRLRQLMGVPTNDKSRKTDRFNKNKKQHQGPVPQEYIKLLATTVKDGLAETDEIEINGDATALKRKTEFVPSDAWFANTVHFKGLPYGVEDAELINSLTEHLSTLGDVKLLRLRRNPKSKVFKGNFLVEYASPEEAEKAAATEGLEYQNSKLEPALLSAYHDEKLAADEFIQPELRKPGGTYPTFEEWCAAHGKKVPAPLNDTGKKEATSNEVEQVPGVLVRFTGVTGDIAFPALKDAFAAAGPVKFVDFEKGNTEGIVRFREPVAAEVIEKNPDGIKLGDDVVLTLSEVDEEAEKAFYERAKAAAANPRPNKRQSGGGHRGGGRGGYRQNKRPRN